MSCQLTWHVGSIYHFPRNWHVFSFDGSIYHFLRVPLTIYYVTLRLSLTVIIVKSIIDKKVVNIVLDFENDK